MNKRSKLRNASCCESAVYENEKRTELISVPGYMGTVFVGYEINWQYTKMKKN
jgi:hypothetical protein